MFFWSFDLFTLIVGGVIVLAILWVISTINGFKRREIKIEEALSGIEVALTKRYDMLTKLLDTAKGFMEHESDLFSRVVSLRHGMSVGEMGQADREMSELTGRGQADREMSELTGRLFAVAENYPELRSSEVFLELQRGIRDAEEHLQAARRLYNANVSSYNIAIAMFPAKLLAKGHSPKEFYDADDEKREDVKMRF